MRIDLRRRRAGFFLLDTVFGFVIAGVVATSLVVAITSSGRAERRLADGARAMRIAQRVMGTVREGKNAPATMEEAQIAVRPMSGGATFEGRGWVEVVVNYHGRRASLVGLVARGGGQ
jgi:type II secretory pathway pseudopilin PulG